MFTESCQIDYRIYFRWHTVRPIICPSRLVRLFELKSPDEQLQTQFQNRFLYLDDRYFRQTILNKNWSSVLKIYS